MKVIPPLLNMQCPICGLPIPVAEKFMASVDRPNGQVKVRQLLEHRYLKDASLGMCAGSGGIFTPEQFAEFSVI